MGEEVENVGENLTKAVVVGLIRGVRLWELRRRQMLSCIGMKWQNSMIDNWEFMSYFI